MPLKLVLASLILGGIAATSKADTSRVTLQSGQSIVQANASLTASGWRPAPERPVLNFEKTLSGTDLRALASCSGTGSGFCRYDYQRDGQRLFVVTVADGAQPQKAGIVTQWWTEP
ncbi:hypothetical protein SynMEDNS5_01445 [Synechococcus sp. MEDNS5]|uniref:hypothetical protein n=1 Tax=Synechococcus sp. MEDNS5 TaxID=1442554 RepID=UPI0016473CAE|nr:hypothetical protein [Synechococcus sp. MEDNS5]QNJ06166.1 hypothetical protein SynMEDNS5_01445 [Synechococcus sp. MEDNS5]